VIHRASKKVNELKTILQDLKLSTTGVKADLIARILEAQNKDTNGATTTETTPAIDLPAAGNTLGDIPAEDTLPSSTTAPVATALATTTQSKKPEEWKPLADLPALPTNTDKQSELEKRAARLARFGGNSEELAKLQRAEKFGLIDSTKGLDDKTISKLDSELSNNKRLPKHANGNAKKPAQNNKPAATRSKPVSKGNNKQASSNKRPPPFDATEEERRKKRAERFGE